IAHHARRLVVSIKHGFASRATVLRPHARLYEALEIRLHRSKPQPAVPARAVPSSIQFKRQCRTTGPSLGHMRPSAMAALSMLLTQPRISSLAPCERSKCLRRASMPLALLMLMWLLLQFAQRLAQLERAQQVQVGHGLPVCVRLNAVLVNELHLV